MFALLWEHDQLDLYLVTKLLITVGDLSALFTSELPFFYSKRYLKLCFLTFVSTEVNLLLSTLYVCYVS